MATASEITALLKDLGLTETEADAYLALLQASRGEPVSGYKVAKDMGRDPANLAKILAALGRHGAVRVVQEKPRLFLPVPPDEFTGQILERMARTQRRTVELLRNYESTPATGTALALTGPDQVLERARLLLGGCQRSATVFASPQVCARLQPFLENLAELPNRHLTVLTTQEIAISGVDVAQIPSPALLGAESDWIQAAIDGEFWLLARLREDGSPQAPSGWWGEDVGLAAVVAAGLESSGAGVPIPAAATDSKTTPEPMAEPMVEPMAESTVEPTVESTVEPTAEPLDPPPEFESEPVAAPEAEPVASSETEAVPEVEKKSEPEAAPSPTEDKDSDDDGFEFIIQHEEKE